MSLSRILPATVWALSLSRTSSVVVPEGLQPQTCFKNILRTILPTSNGSIPNTRQARTLALKGHHPRRRATASSQVPVRQSRPVRIICQNCPLKERLNNTCRKLSLDGMLSHQSPRKTCTRGCGGPPEAIPLNGIRHNTPNRRMSNVFIVKATFLLGPLMGVPGRSKFCHGGNESYRVPLYGCDLTRRVLVLFFDRTSKPSPSTNQPTATIHSCRHRHCQLFCLSNQNETICWRLLSNLPTVRRHAAGDIRNIR